MKMKTKWMHQRRSDGGRVLPPHLFHHLVLLVEELHLDVSTDGERLRELEQHQFVFPPSVAGVRGVDLHLQLIHDKLRVCTGRHEGL